MSSAASQIRSLVCAVFAGLGPRFRTLDEAAAPGLDILAIAASHKRNFWPSQHKNDFEAIFDLTYMTQWSFI
jgi:hypothetical protein